MSEESGCLTNHIDQIYYFTWCHLNAMAKLPLHHQVAWKVLKFGVDGKKFCSFIAACKSRKSRGIATGHGICFSQTQGEI
jgi:hypothetical protein